MSFDDMTHAHVGRSGLLVSRIGVGTIGKWLRRSGRHDDIVLATKVYQQMGLEAYEGLCRELGAKPAEVALAWLLRNPVVSTTIFGATTVEELRADLGALTVQLDDDVVERLDRIWPGSGVAQQAYAW